MEKQVAPQLLLALGAMAYYRKAATGRRSGRRPGWRKLFARKIRIEVLKPEGAVPCPLEWLDSFFMRSFTGRSAFDETLPVAAGEIEASLRVDLEALKRDLEDWLSKKFGEGKRVPLLLEEKPGGLKPL
jgi:hypothetical protein